MNLNKLKVKYNKSGYVIIRKIIKKKEIKEILSELEIIKLKAEKTRNNQFFHKTADGKINTLHNIQKFYKKGKLINVANNFVIKKVVSNFLGDKVKIRNLEFFLKPKKTGMPSPFHQDNYYWNIKEAKAANVWIALSKSSIINGGLCYLKKSHKLGTINHITSYMKGSSQKIPDNIIKSLNFPKIFPKINPGDCLIHHPEVIHGSSYNRSNHDRIGFVVSFAASKSKIYIDKMREYKEKLKNNLTKIY
jgi:ectoine hydroxylase-related dioxygenase (phytanoyl-CoA dioxygenase family)